jgi:hypothetical protein
MLESQINLFCTESLCTSVTARKSRGAERECEPAAPVRRSPTECLKRSVLLGADYESRKRRMELIRERR